jgi:hypothetical protein
MQSGGLMPHNGLQLPEGRDLTTKFNRNEKR